MKSLSETRKARLETQGFRGFSHEDLACHAFGIRFAYGICALLVALGIVLKSIPILVVMFFIASYGAFFSRHPFDYLYNVAIRGLIKRSVLPRRTKQAQFACGIASVWLLVTIYLFYIDLNVAAYIWGSILLAVATLVTTTDICIPSMIYNFLFERKRDS